MNNSGLLLLLLCSSLKYEPAILCHEAKYSTMLLHYADHAFGPIPMTLLPCHRKVLMEYRLLLISVSDVDAQLVVL